MNKYANKDYIIGKSREREKQKSGLNEQTSVAEKARNAFSSCTEKYAFFRIAGHLGVRGFKRKHLKFTLPSPLQL